jgi:hypothetical protein
VIAAVVGEGTTTAIFRRVCRRNAVVGEDSVQVGGTASMIASRNIAALVDRPIRKLYEGELVGAVDRDSVLWIAASVRA